MRGGGGGGDLVERMLFFFSKISWIQNVSFQKISICHVEGRLEILKREGVYYMGQIFWKEYVKLRIFEREGGPQQKTTAGRGRVLIFSGRT